MKFLTIAAIVVYLLVPITNVQAQTDLAVLSAYVTKFHSREKSVTFLKRFENFIIDQQIDAEVATGLSPYISNGLSTIFKLKDSDSYTGLSEYKTLLDEYKLAPTRLIFALENLSLLPLNDSEAKADYRLGQAQVHFIDDFLALEVVNPVNNTAALINAFQVIEDVKGLAIVRVSFFNNFFGSGFGTGKAKLKATVNVRVYNQFGEKVFNGEIAGLSSTKIIVGVETEYDIHEIKNGFEEATINALKRADKKWSKSISKIKWQ